MQNSRRSFLKTAAASVVPVAGLHDLIGQIPAPPVSAHAHVVGTGEDRYGKAHALGFSSIGFKVGTTETGGNLFVIEHSHLMPGGGPALHAHLYQEEWFYVMEGEVAFQVGEQRMRLKAGESVLAPRLVPHAFSAVGQPGRMLIAFTPAGKMEQFFRDVEADPAMATRAEAWTKYEVKYLGPSPFWKSQG